MVWILLLIAVVCFFATFFTTSFALGVLCLLLSLVLVVIATMMLLAARVGGATRIAPMLTAEELRVMRELAERQRNAAAPADPNGPSASTGTSAAPPSTDA